MASNNGNGRLKALEAKVYQDTPPPQPTPAELREDFLYTLHDRVGRNLAYMLPHEMCGPLIQVFNAMDQPWLPKPDELDPDILAAFDEISWHSRLYLAAVLALAQAGLFESPGQEWADSMQARIIELLADDTPDLGRTTSDVCPRSMTWQELIEAQRAAGYGVYGAKPGCTDDQNASRRLSVEIHWRFTVKYWLEAYSADLVREFINLDYAPNLEDLTP